ncbi:class I SAM-dependent methyltransferase [Thermococcus sp. EP1]|uniref:class I SAM-dependent methyltransferase n=1 Tax=Thermococcus sp. EP1 TaxID=1591054 RepID=UPI0009E9143A|nr:class I SAM-dependent methyltransferase [Thermococcus sp. EP1]
MNKDLNSFALEELGFKVIGVDIKKDAIQKAKEITKERGSKAKFYFMDVKRLEFEDDSFDLVALLGSPLPHSSVYDFDEIIREASKRVAKNNKPL